MCVCVCVCVCVYYGKRKKKCKNRGKRKRKRCVCVCVCACVCAVWRRDLGNLLFEVKFMKTNFPCCKTIAELLRLQCPPGLVGPDEFQFSPMQPGVGQQQQSNQWHQSQAYMPVGGPTKESSQDECGESIERCGHTEDKMCRDRNSFALLQILTK